MINRWIFCILKCPVKQKTTANQRLDERGVSGNPASAASANPRGATSTTLRKLANVTVTTHRVIVAPAQERVKKCQMVVMTFISVSGIAF